MRNSEHYPDPTAGRACHRIEHDEYRNALIFREHGFELWQPIVLRDLMTGKIFDGKK